MMRERPQDVVLQHIPKDESLDRHALPLDTVARMLSLLEDFVHPGSSVIEIGTGIGYTSVLLAALVGPTGRVSSVEINSRVADATRRTLRQLRMAGRVHVTTGDATLPGTVLLLILYAVTIVISRVVWHGGRCALHARIRRSTRQCCCRVHPAALGRPHPPDWGLGDASGAGGGAAATQAAVQVQ